MSGPPTPLPRRLGRLLRLAWHLAAGLATTLFRFPSLPEPRRRAEVRRWSRKLLAILDVHVRPVHHPRTLPAHSMLVTNHVSWLDVFVVLASEPSVFVAKSEIRRWPLVGLLCARAGTLFIERDRRGATKAVNAAIVDALRDGIRVSVYPEGTTSDGRGLGRFHAALFQPAIDAGATLVPLALRYLDRQGAYCGAANFVGETTFLASLWSTTAARGIVAELHWLPVIPCANRERRELARVAEAAIAEALGVPVAPAQRLLRNAPGTGVDLQGGSR